VNKHDVAFAAATAAVLAAYNNLGQHERWYLAVNACAAAVGLAAAAAAGLTPDDLGLRPEKLRPGLKLGAAAAAPVVAALGLAALTPATRPLLDDERVARLGRRELAYHVLLRIPLGTVAWEEIAFRGILHAALRRVLAEPAATAAAAAVFGVWHIRPTAEALALNGLTPTRGARITAITSVAAGTAAAGAFLSCLRHRSGSLAAPILVHLAANCTAPLASALARRSSDGAAGETRVPPSSPPVPSRRNLFFLPNGHRFVPPATSPASRRLFSRPPPAPQTFTYRLYFRIKSISVEN
jgi:uncharacterized protein